jgi:ATP-binding cassette subfamily A (ABC1) protein 2
VRACLYRFLVSVCYSKAKLAAACAGVIYFLTYVPYMYIAIREEAAGDRIPAWAKSLAVRSRVLPDLFIILS